MSLTEPLMKLLKAYKANKECMMLTKAVRQLFHRLKKERKQKKEIL